MDAATLVGALVVAAAGLCMGTGAWTLKALRGLKIEHWLFIAMLVGLVLIPWGITLAAFPHALTVYPEVGTTTLVTANIFALGWGFANILCGLCFVRIGVALTGGILGGIGLSLGVMIPMLFKPSGLFNEAADLTSPAGLTLMAGVVTMVAGVILVSLAGFGRDRILNASNSTSGSFLVGLVMAVLAGFLSAGPNFVFAYSQDPIVSRVAMIEPHKEITVKIGATPALGRELSGTYRVDQAGFIHLDRVAEPIAVGGMSTTNAALVLAQTLRASRCFAQPVVKIQTAVGTGVIYPGRSVKVKIAEGEPPHSYIVGPDGMIVPPSIGPLPVGGKSVFAARQLIAEKVRSKNLLQDPAVNIDTHSLLATFPVWTVGMLGGALVNLLFPLYLMRRNRSFAALHQCWKEVPLPAIGGLQFCVAVVLLGIGSLKLGALGASAGWGIYQASQIVAGQAVGFLSGEWSHIHGRPRTQMLAGIGVLLAGAIVAAYGNTQSRM